MDNPEFNNNFITCLSSVSIIKNGVEFTVFPFELSKDFPMESLQFNESINSSNMGGMLFIKDMFGWSEQLNTHSFEKLIIKYTSKKPSNQDLFELKTLEFNIFAVSQVTDRPMKLMMTDGSVYTIIRLDFTTDDIFVNKLTSEFFPEGKDFVGYIASGRGSRLPGLVNSIFSKLKLDQYEIEPTFNGVWIKSNEVSYPWAKHKGQMTLTNLFQYICNYAISSSNVNAVNYFMWRDRDGYHFKSVERMIRDQKNAELEQIYFTTDTGTVNGVRRIEQMHEPNIYQLTKLNVFQSFYEKIVPNYEDYYLDFVDSSISFTRKVVDMDYHKDSNLWSRIERYKIIPDAQKTSVFSEDLAGRRTNAEKTPVQSLRIDDNIYGYYDESRLNTPFPQPWEYIGKTADSRWNDVSYIPQYDMTDLDVITFHTIHKKIREPLREKRARYSYLKNLKRKWEVYRCKVCCLADRLGGIQDQLDIERLQAIQNPNDNADFLALFGPTGIFADSNIEYRIAAAGSFSDVYNFDTTIAGNRGLSLSYDLEGITYGQTIREFYNFAESFDNYEKHIFTNGFRTYDIMIERSQQVITMIDEWLAVVDGYISSADALLAQNLIPDSSDTRTRLGDPTTLNQGPISPPFTQFDLFEILRTQMPPFVRDCSSQKYVFSNFEERIKFVPPVPKPPYGGGLTPYAYYLLTTEGANFTPILNETATSYQDILNLVNNGDVYCPICINPVLLEISKRMAKRHRKVEENRITLLQHIKTTLQQGMQVKWQQARDEYFNRKAFFRSKKEAKIDENIQNLLVSNLSLLNIKKITRKPVRGSRYEILARNRGITGAEVGPYLYNVFFDDYDLEVPGDIEGVHPYYDAGYDTSISADANIFSAYVPLPQPRRSKVIKDILLTNNGPYASQFAYTQYRNNNEFPGFVEMHNQAPYALSANSQSIIDLTFSNNTLRRLSQTHDVSQYDTRFNLFRPDVGFIKPPNIKREELSSYVRIEFSEPIGLDSIVDFPDGFVRNAGYEYFLPYIVSLTAGPNGRQTINQNVVVIGMDPYGFDVAMKRMKEPELNGKFYWWNAGIESPGMDLWPEIAFETRYPYYTMHQPDERMFLLNDDIDGSLSGSRYFTVSNLYTREDRSSAGTAFNTYSETAFPLNIISDPSRLSDNFTNDYNNNDEQPNNKITHSKYEPFLRNTLNASNYLFDSHRVKKVQRNWWSFHIPDNLLIVPYFQDVFENIEVTPSYASGVGVDNPSARENIFFNDYPQPFSSLDPSDSPVEDCKLRLRRVGIGDTNLKTLLDSFDANQEPIQFFFEESHFDYKLNGFKDDSGILNSTHPSLQKYFTDITNWWMTGDHIIYRPGILTEDVWKYDISGHSDYGVVHPPVQANHSDIFDSNFAAQFVVFARTSKNFCLRNNLTCINPNAPVYTTGCTAGNPYCNCPAQDRKPNAPEPSYLELYKLEQELKECSLIEQHLGQEWLGCVWSSPENTGSCNCPEIGDKFMDYLAYSRTYATFWSTPAKTPLYRNTQYNLLFAQTLQVIIPRNENIKIGSIVSVEDRSEINEEKYRRFGGKWLVTEISNIFYANKDFMSLTLNRDSFSNNPNRTNQPEV